MSDQATFERLKARWQSAHERQGAMRETLASQYGDAWRAPRGKRGKFEQLRERESAAMDAFFDWLDAHGGRNFRVGAPAYWLCENLTYADAVTTGTMSMVPPVCYGGSVVDALRFASAVVRG